jgi:hypothetical protein
MASHFKWYPGSDNVIVPWNAQYSFPSQANKSIKMTPRIPPKNGGSFTPGQVIRLEFPAQGYVNPQNTTLEFDVTLTGYGTPGFSVVRFQNNIQSLFSRVRLLYGSTPLEDIINYNVITRCLTEWTSTGQQGLMDQQTICDGIGGVTLGLVGQRTTGNLVAPALGNIPTRQAYIQGRDTSGATTANGATGTGFVGWGIVPNSTCTRRYQVQLALGLFTQDKLIPTKFMASQLAIEITLETPQACIFTVNPSSGGGSGTDPTYTVSNVNLIPEILEFDASYGKLFFNCRCHVFERFA